jgi:VWFA-related protein
VALAGAIALSGSMSFSQVPVFRGSVDYVRVEAVVTNDRGVPVVDLKAADFEIRERGRIQEIVDFQFAGAPELPGLEPAPLLAMDVASNVVDGRARLFVLVIDDLHTIPQHLPLVHRTASDFLNALSPGDVLAVVFPGRPDLSQDFTTDPSKWTRAIERSREALGFALGPIPIDPNSPEVAQRRNYAMTVLTALQNMSSILANSVFSRRAVVLIGGGIDLDFADSGDRDLANEYLKTIEAAERADVRIYSIDPRGLGVSPETALRSGFDTGSPGATSVSRASQIASSRLVKARIDAQQDFLRTIAANTGGLSAVNRSNLTTAVREIVEDNSKYYVLGYYPRPAPPDGQFQPLTVSVKRPNVTVRARRGYVPRTGQHEAGSTANLQSALVAGLPIAGLRLAAVALPISHSGGRVRTLLTTEVTYPVRSTEGFRDTFQFGMLVVDAEGSVKAKTERELMFSVAREDSSETTLAINEVVDLAPGFVTARLGVISRALATAGTVHVTIDVTDPERAELSVGSVALGLATAKVRAMRREVLEGLIPFQPTARRVFSQSDTLEVFAPVSWRGQDDHASVEIVLRSSGAVHYSTVESVSAARKPGSPAHALLRVEVPLASVPPGICELQVRASLPGGVTRTRTVRLRIE